MKYNQLVDPMSFDLVNQPSQVRDTEVQTTNVPATMESMRNHQENQLRSCSQIPEDGSKWVKYGQLSPCTVSKDSMDRWVIRDGYTRAAAMQQRAKVGENVKLLINNGVEQIEKPDEEFDWEGKGSVFIAS